MWVISGAISLSLNLVQSVLGTDASGELGAFGALLAGAALLFTYLVLCWIVGGRTIGQLLLGLRVRRVGGGRIGFSVHRPGLDGHLSAAAVALVGDLPPERRESGHCTAHRGRLRLDEGRAPPEVGVIGVGSGDW